MKKLWLIAICVSAPFLMGADGSGCSQQYADQQAATTKALDRKTFIPTNDLDFKNYDRRQKVADDPTAILWCTSSFPIPSSPLFTFPVVGKLTSGGKRPFATDPGPDAMYGSSGDYRYGFTPNNIYIEYYNMPTFCTTEPTVWQRQETKMAMATDSVLLAAHKAAQQALKAGKGDEAVSILTEALKQSK